MLQLVYFVTPGLHIFEGILLICSLVNPFETDPNLSPSSSSCSYVMLSGLSRSALLLSSIALYNYLSSSQFCTMIGSPPIIIILISISRSSIHSIHHPIITYSIFFPILQTIQQVATLSTLHQPLPTSVLVVSMYFSQTLPWPSLLIPCSVPLTLHFPFSTLLFLVLVTISSQQSPIHHL